MEATLQGWHEFFTLIGTAAVTIIGAMFVVVSVGIRLIHSTQRQAITAFLSGTVINLSAVLLGSSLSFVPELDSTWFSALVVALGLVGLILSPRRLVPFRSTEEIVRTGDRFWYLVLPHASYASLVIVGFVAYWNVRAGFDLVALALVILLISGIRNAWDMVLFLIRHADNA